MRGDRTGHKLISSLVSRLAAALFTALSATVVYAQVPTQLPPPIPDRFEISILAGYQLNSNLTWAETTPYTSVDIADCPTLGVTGGYFLSPGLEVEIEYSYAKPKATAIARTPGTPSANFDIGIHQFQFVGVTNFARPSSSWIPYLGLGLGFTILNGSPTLENTDRLSFSVLLGVKKYFERNVGVRLEFRWAPAYLYTTGNGVYFCFPDYGCFNTGDRYLQQIDFRGGVTFRF